MEPNKAYRQRRRRRRRSPLGRVFRFCLICLVLFFGISVFFQVSAIYVNGETRYSSAEVIEAAGVGYGTRLFLVNNSAVESGIRARLPFANEVEVSRRFPSRLEITVNDAAPIAAVWSENGYLILDKQSRVLERGDRSLAEGLISIQGVNPILPVEGQVLVLGDEEREKVAYLRELLSALAAAGIADQVESIDLSRATDLRLRYADRFEVHFGPNRHVEEKVRALVRVSEALGDLERGVIDLSQGRNAYFRPAT